MSAKTPPDDLEAVRTIVDALKDFQSNDQERILRWAREKLGLSSVTARTQPTLTATDIQAAQHPPTNSDPHSSNIKSFVKSKNPKSDTQFAAVVAYYYQFEGTDADRKDRITGEDLQEACRKADWVRLRKPAQTLVNAYNQGYFDKTGERGAYAINAVGENLVAMALPEGADSARAPKVRNRRQVTNKRAGRRKG